MRGIRLLRRRRVEENREIPSELLEGIIFFLNSVVFIGLGATILRLSDVAKLHLWRIQAVAPDYAHYVGYGFVVGYMLLAFAVVQMLFAALKFYDVRAKRRVEILLRTEVTEDAP